MGAAALLEVAAAWPGRGARDVRGEGALLLLLLLPLLLRVVVVVVMLLRPLATAGLLVKAAAVLGKAATAFGKAGPRQIASGLGLAVAVPGRRQRLAAGAAAAHDCRDEVLLLLLLLMVVLVQLLLHQGWHQRAPRGAAKRRGLREHHRQRARG